MSSYLSHRRKGFQGGVTAFNGFGNRSRSFDGVSDYIATANDVDAVLDGAFTISFWLKLGDGQPSATQQFFGVDNVTDIARMLVTTGGVIRAVYRSDNGTVSVADLATSLTNGQQAWVHYAWVVTPAGQKIYVDGSEATLDGTNDGDMTGVTMGNFATVLDFYIGSRNFNGSGADFTSGNYADFRIYDTDLTATDISDIYNGTNVTTNLVGHWLTDADNVLDAAGTNHGTNYGSKYSYDNPSPPVEFGSASRIFNGTSNRVTIPANVFNGATALTVSAWIKLDSLGINQTVIGRIDNNSGFRLMVRDTNQIDLIWGDGSSFLVSTLDGAVLTSGSWIHVAGTFDNSGDATRYVDGVQTGTIDDLSSYGALSILGDIGIGARVQTTNPLYNLPLDGKIADVRIYDAELTASQISDLYAGTDVTANLVGHYLTDNDDVEDKAGTNDGTNFGSTYSYEAPLPANKLIDTYASACGAYSLRELTTAWAGQPVVDVRRVSDGSINSFTSTEITDGTLASFCGTSGGFVSKVYDQSGNGFDLIQPTEGDQPRIYTGATQTVSTSNGLPCLDFDGAYLYNANSFDYEGGVSWYSVVKMDTFGGTRRLWCDDIIGVNGYVSFLSDGSYFLNDGAGYKSHTFSGETITQQLKSYNFDESQGSYVYGFNGSSTGGSFGTWAGSIETNGSANIGVMGAGNGTQTTNGLWQELIIYPNDQLHNKENIERNINEFYSIY